MHLLYESAPPTTNEATANVSVPLPSENLSKVGSEALTQVASLLQQRGADLLQVPELIEHTHLGSYLSLPAAIAFTYRPDLLKDSQYMSTRVKAFRALRYGNFFQFWQEFHAGSKEALPVAVHHKLNDLREANKQQVYRRVGHYVPVFLYSDLHHYANLLQDYAEALAEHELTEQKLSLTSAA